MTDCEHPRQMTKAGRIPCAVPDCPGGSATETIVLAFMDWKRRDEPVTRSSGASASWTSLSTVL